MIAYRTLVIGLTIACLWNMSLGISAYIGHPPLIYWIGDVFYGISYELNPIAQQILRILGAFMIGEGLLCAFALKNPRGHAPIAFAFVIILWLRAFQTWFFGDELQTHFHMQTIYLWGQVMLYALFGTFMLWASITITRQHHD